MCASGPVLGIMPYDTAMNGAPLLDNSPESTKLKQRIREYEHMSQTAFQHHDANKKGCRDGMWLGLVPSGKQQHKTHHFTPRASLPTAQSLPSSPSCNIPVNVPRIVSSVLDSSAKSLEYAYQSSNGEVLDGRTKGSPSLCSGERECCSLLRKELEYSKASHHRALQSVDECVRHYESLLQIQRRQQSAIAFDWIMDLVTMGNGRYAQSLLRHANGFYYHLLGMFLGVTAALFGLEWLFISLFSGPTSRLVFTLVLFSYPLCVLLCTAFDVHQDHDRLSSIPLRVHALHKTRPLQGTRKEKSCQLHQSSSQYNCCCGQQQLQRCKSAAVWFFKVAMLSPEALRTSSPYQLVPFFVCQVSILSFAVMQFFSH